MGAWKELQLSHTRTKSGRIGKVEFQGFDEMVAVFDQMPAEIQKKIVVNVLRKAGKTYKETLQAAIPDFKEIITAKSTKSKQAIAIGPYANKTYVSSSGQTWDLYQLLYWQNYGTLASRSSQHKFLKPRGRKSIAWRGGIAPRMLIENAYSSTKGEIESQFEVEFKNNIVRVLRKFAVK